MLTGTVWVALATQLLMLALFYFSTQRRLHMVVMISLMIFDLCMPFYLYATHDWKKQLIDHGDITSFGAWTHFGLVLTLYMLYAFQIVAARGILRDTSDARATHHGQGVAILVVRFLVIISGVLLTEPM